MTISGSQPKPPGNPGGFVFWASGIMRLDVPKWNIKPLRFQFGTLKEPDRPLSGLSATLFAWDQGGDMKSLLPLEIIEKRIVIIRGHKVMLDRHLAELYMVEAKVLNRAVKRNLDRFPEDFMFQLTGPERENLKCQFGTSSWGGDRRALPYAFTEQGVAMLSSALRSKKAIYVNIQIMRAFASLRALLSTHKDLARKLQELEKKYDSQFRNVFDAIRALMEPSGAEPKRIEGFKP